MRTVGDSRPEWNHSKRGGTPQRDSMLIGLSIQLQNKQSRTVTVDVECDRKKFPPFHTLVVRRPIALMKKPPLLKSLFCSPRLHLFDQNYSKKLNIIKKIKKNSIYVSIL